MLRDKPAVITRKVQVLLIKIPLSLKKGSWLLASKSKPIGDSASSGVTLLALLLFLHERFPEVIKSLSF